MPSQHSYNSPPRVHSPILNDTQSGLQRCIEPAIDSSRAFAMKLQSAKGQHAWIGLVFTERNQAFDFWHTVQRSSRSTTSASPAEESTSFAWQPPHAGESSEVQSSTPLDDAQFCVDLPKPAKGRTRTTRRKLPGARQDGGATGDEPESVATANDQSAQDLQRLSVEVKSGTDDGVTMRRMNFDAFSAEASSANLNEDEAVTAGQTHPQETAAPPPPVASLDISSNGPVNGLAISSSEESFSSARESDGQEPKTEVGPPLPRRRCPESDVGSVDVCVEPTKAEAEAIPLVTKQSFHTLTAAECAKGLKFDTQTRQESREKENTICKPVDGSTGGPGIEQPEDKDVTMQGLKQKDKLTKTGDLIPPPPGRPRKARRSRPSEIGAIAVGEPLTSQAAVGDC